MQAPGLHALVYGSVLLVNPGRSVLPPLLLVVPVVLFAWPTLQSMTGLADAHVEPSS